MEKAKWVIGILLSITMFSLGFGVSQMTLASEVHVNSNRITTLERSIIDLHQADLDEGHRSDTRIFEAVGLMKELVKQNTELISLIRVQYQIKGQP